MPRNVPVFALILIAAAFSTRAAEEENPFKKAKVGDWVEYKLANKMAGMSMEMEMRSTLSKKTDTEATVDVVTKMSGQEFKSSYTVKLNEKYDPRATGVKDFTIKETGRGEETLTIGGKSLKTTWTSYEVSGKAEGGAPMNSKGKAWISSEVPLNGLVKSEQEIAGTGKQQMELKDFGSGK
jgi:hypothetical protein